MNNMGEELLNTDIYLGGELVGVPAKAIQFSTQDNTQDEQDDDDGMWVQHGDISFDVNLEPDSVKSLWDIIFPKLHVWQVNQTRLPRKKKKTLKKQLQKMLHGKVKLEFLKTKP